MKTAYFDMDGTIADFYGVDNWLDYLTNYDTYPYRSARPMFSPSEIETLICSLLEQGYRIGIISWCSKRKDKKYNKEIERAKREWIKEFLTLKQEIHIVADGVR